MVFHDLISLQNDQILKKNQMVRQFIEDTSFKSLFLFIFSFYTVRDQVDSPNENACSYLSAKSKDTDREIAHFLKIFLIKIGKNLKAADGNAPAASKWKMRANGCHIIRTPNVSEKPRI